MTVPITIRCECGAETPASLGASVRCTCGRRYETSTMPTSSAGSARALQARIRFYARLGMVLIAAAAVGGYLIQGLPGLALATPAAAVVWFRVVQPRFKRRIEAELRTVPGWTLQAEPSSDVAP
jgi:hypothetical protein